MRVDRIKNLLPMVFQEGLRRDGGEGLLELFLFAMQELHSPVERNLDQLDRFIDPRRAPEEFLPFLAAWVDLEPHAVPGQLRELVARYVEVSHAYGTGTRLGMIAVLELVTGTTGFEIKENVDSSGALEPFHIEVLAPAALKPHERLLRAVIDREKPAFVTAALVFKAE